MPTDQVHLQLPTHWGLVYPKSYEELQNALSTQRKACPHSSHFIPTSLPQPLLSLDTSHHRECVAFCICASEHDVPRSLLTVLRTQYPLHTGESLSHSPGSAIPSHSQKRCPRLPGRNKVTREVAALSATVPEEVSPSPRALAGWRLGTPVRDRPG